MSSENPERNELSTKNTRRKILKATTATGLSGLAFSGVAAADDNSEESEDRIQITLEDILGEEVHDMSDEEIETELEKLWDEGTGDTDAQFAPQMTENCLSETLNFESVPGIDLELCLLDQSCGVEVEAGLLGYTETFELESCSRICRTIEIDVLAVVNEFIVCYDHSASQVEVTLEECSWGISGWSCSTIGDKTINLPW